ncbi:MAG: hypothetical protein ACRENE_13015 [Polyangiaceae bacterium]
MLTDKGKHPRHTRRTEPADLGAGTEESGARPRPRFPTLVGVGPEGPESSQRAPVVVGAVARPNPIPTPVATEPGLFDAIGRMDDDDEEAWPEPPPPAPAEPHAAPAPRARSGRVVWAAAVLAACGALTAFGWQVHALRGKSSLPPRVAALPLPAPTPAPVGPPAGPEPPAEVSPPAALPPDGVATSPLFDAVAAEHALAATAKAVARCRHGRVYGKGQATVTFGDDGAVTQCVLSARFRETAAGACVATALSAVHAAPFSGEPRTVVHPFEVAPQ